MASTPLTGLTVLVLDDEALLRRHVAATLERLGADVSVADCVSAARRLANELNFDFVLLDVHMPVMDGVETIGRIRRSAEVWRDIPVIALTADAMTGDRERLLSLGLDGYVSKPIDQSELLTVIGRVLGAPTETPSAATQSAATSVDLDDILADLDKLAG